MTPKSAPKRQRVLEDLRFLTAATVELSRLYAAKVSLAKAMREYNQGTEAEGTAAQVFEQVFAKYRTPGKGNGRAAP
jgi:hypothetical protein